MLINYFRKMEREYERIKKMLIKRGYIITKTIKEENKYIIVSHVNLHGDYDNPEIFFIRLYVITKKGMNSNKIELRAMCDESNTLKIGDILVDEEDICQGYGSILMEELISYTKIIGIKKIYGEIAAVDWDHIDRLKHFYTKFCFDIELYDNL